MTETISTLIEKGRPYLRQYLESMGVQVRKNGRAEMFRCIHPDHSDSNPSAGIIPESNGEAFYCFGCQVSGTVYTAAHFLEGKPLHGPGFIQDNVAYILNLFNIEHGEVVLTEQQILDIKYTILYSAAADLFSAIGEDGMLIYNDTTNAKARGWTEETCIKHNIGSIKDFDSFISCLNKRTSITRDQIFEMGITADLFGPRLITFAVRDHLGVVRGFAARFVDWKEGDSVEKYRNTSMIKNPFYKKSRLLYGLDIAKRYHALRLDIFEGYGSEVTALQAGYKNCVAIGGTAFTQEHVQLLHELGFRHINFVMDQDETGKAKMSNYIEQLGGYHDMKVTIMMLPIKDEHLAIKGQNDVDFFIRQYGIDEYRKIRTIGAFEHLIRKSTPMVKDSEEAIKFAKDMIKLVAKEADKIEQGRMLRVLSEHSGVDKDDLKEELYRLTNMELEDIKKSIEKRLKNAKDPDVVSDILDSAREQLVDSGSTKQDRYLTSIGESVETWDEIFGEMNVQKEGIHGWVTGYNALDTMLDGISKPSKGGVVIGIAGAPQHGKSAALLNISLEVARRNNDVSVLYWAIDDNRKAIANRLVSMISGVSIKKVRRIVVPTDEEMKKIKEAQELIRYLTMEQKLIFKDDRFGRSKKKAETWIQEIQDSSGRMILFCVDSLHNVGTTSTVSTDERVRLKYTSTWLKEISNRMPLTAMATLELVKARNSEKPTLLQISESGKMEYDFDTLAIAYMEAQAKYGAVEDSNAKWGSPGFWKPIIELDFQKNKAAAGEKGPVYFKYDPATTRFVESMSKLEGLEQAKPKIMNTTDGKFYAITAPASDGKLISITDAKPNIPGYAKVLPARITEPPILSFDEENN